MSRTKKTLLLSFTTLFILVISFALHTEFERTELRDRAINTQLPLEQRFKALEELGESYKAREAWATCAKDPKTKLQFLSRAGKIQAKAAAEALLESLKNTTRPLPERLVAIESLARTGAKGPFPALTKILENERSILALAAAEALIRTGEADKGFKALFSYARLERTRSLALFRLERVTGQKFPVHPSSGPAKAALEVERWEQWWETHKSNFEARSY